MSPARPSSRAPARGPIALIRLKSGVDRLRIPANAGAKRGQAVEEDQKPGEGHDEDESETDVKDDLAIRPAGVLARLGPLALGDRGHHSVKLASRGIEVRPKARALRLKVGGCSPTQRARSNPMWVAQNEFAHLKAAAAECWAAARGVPALRELLSTRPARRAIFHSRT
jgi:hypothetical protein